MSIALEFLTRSLPCMSDHVFLLRVEGKEIFLLFDSISWSTTDYVIAHQAFIALRILSIVADEDGLSYKPNALTSRNYKGSVSPVPYS